MGDFSNIAKHNALQKGIVGSHFEKAYEEGIYSDTPTNRKLGRVGKKYSGDEHKAAERKNDVFNEKQVRYEDDWDEEKEPKSLTKESVLKHLNELKYTPDSTIPEKYDSFIRNNNIAYNPEKGKWEEYSDKEAEKVGESIDEKLEKYHESQHVSATDSWFMKGNKIPVNKINEIKISSLESLGIKNSYKSASISTQKDYMIAKGVAMTIIDRFDEMTPNGPVGYIKIKPNPKYNQAKTAIGNLGNNKRQNGIGFGFIGKR